MDQVLFSEPSTKMKEKMEAIRCNLKLNSFFFNVNFTYCNQKIKLYYIIFTVAELGRTAENVNDTTNEESKQQSQMEENLSEEEKFLKDRFGSQ